MLHRSLPLCLIALLATPLAAQDGQVLTKEYDDGGIYEGSLSRRSPAGHRHL